MVKLVVYHLSSSQVFACLSPMCVCLCMCRGRQEGDLECLCRIRYWDLHWRWGRSEDGWHAYLWTPWPHLRGQLCELFECDLHWDERKDGYWQCTDIPLVYFPSSTLRAPSGQWWISAKLHSYSSLLGMQKLRDSICILRLQLQVAWLPMQCGLESEKECLPQQWNLASRRQCHILDTERERGGANDIG